MMIGPFDLKHLVIVAAITIVTWVAMYLLKGLLSFAFMVALWILVGVLVTVVMVIALLAITIVGYLRFGREGFLFAQARKTGVPVFIDAEIGSLNAEFILGEKANPKDVVLSDETSGIKLDPSLMAANANPLRFNGGLDIFSNAYYNFQAQSVRNHAAFQEMDRYFTSDKCKDLNFLTMKEFSELVSCPEHYLQHNAYTKLNKYFKVAEKLDANGNPVMVQNENGEMVPKLTYVREFRVTQEDGTEKWIEQDLDLPEMIRKIAEARRDLAVMPIMGGYLTLTEAFKNNSVSYSAQHLAHVLMLYKKKLEDEFAKKLEWMTVGIAALMILCGCGVCIYIISMAYGKAA